MCAIIGIISKKRNVVPDGTVLLNAENNRGEQACGAAVFDGNRTRYYYGEGRVAEVFGPRNEKKVKQLVGSVCVMHTLYSTVGPCDSKKQPVTQQPIIFRYQGKLGAIAHNGNLVRLEDLRSQAKRAGYKFKSRTSDTEVIAALLSVSTKKDFLEALVDVLKQIEGKGAFSLVIMYGGKLYGVRDQNGIRPLCIIKKSGKYGDNDSFIFSSESSVYPALEATRFVRDVDMGEIVVFGEDGIERSVKWTESTKSSFCVCEFIYLASSASRFFGVSAYAFRVKAGQMSARKHPAKVDVIAPIPDSGRGYNDGFSSESGIPSRGALVKNRYGGARTFMEPRQVKRAARQIAKLQALPDVMNGQNVCLIDDSLFRGSVAPTVVKISREHGGARQVHLRICSPPVCHRCHLGLDTPTTKELLASHMTITQIRDQVIHSDSLEYLTVEELRQVLRELGLSSDDFCLGCFTGKYPVDPPAEKK